MSLDGVVADPAAGQGRSTDRVKHMLALRESETYSNGVLKLVYDVKR